MCGIIGIKDTPINRENLDYMFALLSHRGTDSYGYILESKDETTTSKSLTLNPLLEDLDKEPQGNFILCHNRKTSVGGTTLPLAHPITSKNDKIAIIHNGTKKSLYNVISEAKSDTDAMSVIISAQFQASPLMKELLTGAGVVFAKNQDTGQVLFHSDEERPLFIHENKEIFASEPIGVGVWHLVKAHTKIYDSFEDFINNAETYEKTVTIEPTDTLESKYCAACGKTHIKIETRCPACIIKDIPIQTTTYSSYGTYYNRTQPSTYPLYKAGNVYEYSNDKQIWVKGILTRRLFNGTKKYECKGIMYEHIREVKKEVITPTVGKSYSFFKGDMKLHGVLTEIINGKYTLQVSETESITATYLDEEIPDHPILKEGETYEFWDSYSQNVIRGVFEDINHNNAKYPYRCKPEGCNYTTSYANVRAIDKVATTPKGKTKEKVLTLVRSTLGEWLNAYVLGKSKGEDFKCEDPDTGIIFFATEVEARPPVYKDELLEVSNDNVYWEFGIIDKDIPKGNQEPIEATVWGETALKQKFKYYREYR